jgi:hypothetical protein
VSKTYFAALLAALFFAGDPSVLYYSAFVCHDTFALTWSLLMIALFPRAFASRNYLAMLGYSVLVGIGGWFAWQCFLVPVACCGALFLSNRRELRQRPLAAVLPILVAFLFGVALITVFARVEAAHKPNGWGESETLFAKLALRTGYSNYREAGYFAIQHVKRIMAARSLGVLFLLLMLVETCKLPAGSRREIPFDNAEDRWASFYLHSLWLFPLLWLAAMPNMHRHDFQGIFAVPIFAVGVPRILTASLAMCSENCARLLKSIAVLVAVLLLMVAYHNKPQGSICYKNMIADVQKCASRETPVVVAFEDRGLWWRLDRPVVGVANMDILEKQRMPYIVVAPQEWVGPSGTTFELLANRGRLPDLEEEYKILRRKYD